MKRNQSFVPKKESDREYMLKIAEALDEKRFNDAKLLCFKFLNITCKGNDALKVAELLVKLDSQNADAFNLLGLVNFGNGEYVAAGASYEKAVKLNPRHGMAIMNYGNLMHACGRLKEAMQFLVMSLDYLDIKYHHAVYSNMANIYLDQSLPEKALEVAIKSYTLKPDDVGICSILGNIYVVLKNDLEAEKYYLEALSLNPERDMVVANIAQLYERIDNKEKAKEFFAKTIKICSSYFGSDVSKWSQDQERVFYQAQMYIDNPIRPENILINENMDERIIERGEIYKEINNRQCVAKIENIKLVGNGWSIVDDKKLYQNMVFCIPSWRKRFVLAMTKEPHSYVRHIENVSVIDEPAIVLGGANNYYHWICDYLPRLELLQSCPELASLPIIMNDDLSGFQKESLELLGIDMTRIIGVNADTYVQLSQAYLLYFNGRPLFKNNSPDWMNPALTKMEVDWLRKAYAPWMKPKKENPKRLFLSRKGAKFRLCINEDEIFEIAKEYGFEKVQNEKLSFAEQISLYSGIEAVFGVHGAGFTNMIFAPSNATMIEMHSKNELPSFYVHMAQIIGQKHFGIEGLVTQTLRPLTQPFWNFEIDPKKVCEQLEKLGKLK